MDTPSLAPGDVSLDEAMGMAPRVLHQVLDVLPWEHGDIYDECWRFSATE
jgi:hypothetical protein